METRKDGISDGFEQLAASCRPSLKIAHITGDFSIARLDDPAWNGASQTLISRYWSGMAAETGREFSARLLWSDAALYVRFIASRNEPLVLSEKPDVTTKTLGLWDRDVCEIFIAPDRNNRNRYFEFEVGPTGEWVDLGIELTPHGRKTDSEYTSGMIAVAKIEKDSIVMAIKIPWEAFGARPKAGDVWLGNIFRCVGKGPGRGYLAWQPTQTPKPAFHVPAAFGEFEFGN
jgi:hypothetical protein